jgi:hypothetical protein
MMAIRSGDCVVRIRDLEIGSEEVKDVWGDHTWSITKYEPFWENFLAHVKQKIKTLNKDPIFDDDVIINQELKAYRATFKRTRRWDDSYIKFRSAADYTFFVLKWS